jgi:hypothetical protein
MKGYEYAYIKRWTDLEKNSGITLGKGKGTGIG